jgi:SNF2 family DNA or RNA helicase
MYVLGSLCPTQNHYPERTDTEMGENVMADAEVEDAEAADGLILPLMQIGNEMAFSPEETVYLLTKYLAGRCDGARQQDGVGFNKLHADFGHRLAEIPFEYWSPRQLWSARKMLQTYKNTQIAQWWELVPEIPEPQTRREVEYREWKQKQDPAFVPQPTFRRLVLTELDGQDVVELQHNFDPVLVEKIKLIPQRRWIADRKAWIVPVQYDTLEAIAKFACEFGYEIDPAVEAKITAVMDAYAERVELSHARDGDYSIKLPDGLELYPFQRIGVQYAEKAGNVLIADQMGLGKTVQGLLALDVTESFPAIIVCPATIKVHWSREAKKWIPGRKIAILSGRKPVNLRDQDGRCRFDMIVVNYDILSGWKDALIEINPKALIVDECHKVKNPNSGRSMAVEAIIDAVPSVKRIFLSGTPVVNRPMEFWTLIKLLGYSKEMGGVAEYRRRYDNDYRDRLEELNTRARSYFMIRRLKADVLPELPDKQRITVPIDIDNRREYVTAEQDIAGYFAKKALQTEEYEDQLVKYEWKAAKMVKKGEMTEEEGKKFVQTRMKEAFSAEFGRAYAIASRNEELLRWEALKQLAVKGKMAWAKA